MLKLRNSVLSFATAMLVALAGAGTLAAQGATDTTGMSTPATGTMDQTTPMTSPTTDDGDDDGMDWGWLGLLGLLGLAGLRRPKTEVHHTTPTAGPTGTGYDANRRT